jgi:hypothetical protein
MSHQKNMAIRTKCKPLPILRPAFRTNHRKSLLPPGLRLAIRLLTVSVTSVLHPWCSPSNSDSRFLQRYRGHRRHHGARPPSPSLSRPCRPQRLPDACLRRSLRFERPPLVASADSRLCVLCASAFHFRRARKTPRSHCQHSNASTRS